MRVRRIKPGETYRNELGPFTEGMDEVTAAHLMPEKRLRDAVNVIIDEKTGSVLQRLGREQISTFPTANPPRDRFVFTRSDGSEYLLISDGLSLYVTLDLINYTLLITGLDADSFLQFEVAEEKVWITNGTNYVMSYDGTDLIIYDREATGVVGAGSSATQIVDAARTEIDDYWNKRKIVITSGEFAGVLYGTVTDFVQATGIMTISGFNGQAPEIGSTYAVGVIIPRGSVIRYLKSRIFMGATPENLSEIRFNEIADPDTGEFINIDNPRAWPATNQIAVAQHDGDRIWGFSPILDERFLICKKSAIYRLDEDQTFLFVPKLIENSIGSIFPDTWQVKKGLLTFLGTEKSGYVDLYVSDLVRVKPLYDDGRMQLSFSDIRQAIPIFKYLSKSTTEQFNTGDISDGCDTSSGELKPKNFNFTSRLNGILNTKSNIAIGDNEGEFNIKAQPNWSLKYDGDVLPENASPTWTIIGDAAIDRSIVSGVYKIAHALTGVRKSEMRQPTPFDSSKDIMAIAKFRSDIIFPPAVGAVGYVKSTIKIATGSYKVELDLLVNSGSATSSVLVNGNAVATVSKSDINQWNILIKSDGNYKIWKDGLLFNSGSAASTTENMASFIHEANNSGSFSDIRISELDYFYYQNNIVDTDIPNTLPQTGNVDFILDYTRIPDAFGKLYYDAILNGGSITMQTASSDDGIVYSSLLSLGNGKEPGVDNATVKKRYLKIRFNFTSVNIANGPIITNFLAGFLWRSGPLLIGQNISDWKKYLHNITTPTGTGLVIKIRIAKTIGTPLEGNFEAWNIITDGNDIGIILGDTVLPPPINESRWVDIKIEGSPSNVGLSPQFKSFILNWVEGATANLPVRSMIFENRYYLISAQATTGYNDRVFVLNKKTAWTRFMGWNLNAMAAFSGLILGFASDSNKIYQLFIVGKYDDDGVAIDSYIDLPEIDFGPSRAMLRELMIENAAQGTLKVLVKKQGDSDFAELGTITYSGHNTKKIRAPIGTISKQFGFRIQNNVNNENMDVRVVGYRTEGMPEDYN